MYDVTFTLKPEHILLLHNMYVDWDDSMYHGAPEVNIKRPYGNSYVLADLAEILHVEPDDPDCEDFSQETQDYLFDLHGEMATALQVVLHTLSFEPGVYKKPRYSGKWTRVFC